MFDEKSFTATIPIPEFIARLLSFCGLVEGEQFMESQLIKLLCYIMFMVGVIVFAILSFIPAVYGRYAGPKSWFGFGVNANVSWFFQESPSFFIPVVFWLLEFWRTGTLDLTQTALASMFVFHYWQRFVWQLNLFRSCLLKGVMLKNHY